MVRDVDDDDNGNAKIYNIIFVFFFRGNIFLKTVCLSFQQTNFITARTKKNKHKAVRQIESKRNRVKERVCVQQQNQLYRIKEAIRETLDTYYYGVFLDVVFFISSWKKHEV